MAELQPLEEQINGAAMTVASMENVGAKRQRRPSVRLGDIGDQAFDSHVNRRTKHWRIPMKDSGKASKSRVMMNLGGGGGDYHETLNGEDREGNLDSVAIGSWKVKDSKSKRGLSTKRVRSHWIPMNDEGDGGRGGELEEKFCGGEDVDDRVRGFDPEVSQSPLKEHSPINSLDMAVDMERGQGNERDVHFRGHRDVRARVSEDRGPNDGVELDRPSYAGGTNWNNSERDGVRVWLNQLGLGRYAPVFEIHEVDDEVLPMLTLEDLKDMGINAVGSRRKMYCAIQKLGKGFS